MAYFALCVRCKVKKMHCGVKYRRWIAYLARGSPSK